MSTRTAFQMEMPWELEGRALLISGDVYLGGRWPRVEGFRCIDLGSQDDLELLDASQDAAEDLLIEEASRMWGTP